MYDVYVTECKALKRIHRIFSVYSFYFANVNWHTIWFCALTHTSQLRWVLRLDLFTCRWLSSTLLLLCWYCCRLLVCARLFVVRHATLPRSFLDSSARAFSSFFSYSVSFFCQPVNGTQTSKLSLKNIIIVRTLAVAWRTPESHAHNEERLDRTVCLLPVDGQLQMYHVIKWLEYGILYVFMYDSLWLFVSWGGRIGLYVRNEKINE